ncbi:hypothetical protein DOTSEDRAFT_178563, partial [Dothistroma septosporum NZE10]
MERRPDDSQLSIASVAFPVEAEMTARPASSSGHLTLKEHTKHLDTLTKENFDLKLKITFLEDAIRTRSQDGVEDLINQTVSLQTELAHERRETQSMRRKVRTLEQQSQKLEEALRNAETSRPSREYNDDDDPILQANMHEEILYLRQQLDRTENTITTLRDEVTTKEFEKRKMADHVRSMAEKRGQDSAASNGTPDMWQQLLNTETTRREQAEEIANDLRNELSTLRLKVAAVPRRHASTRASPRSPARRSSRSRSASRPRSDPEQDIIDVMEEHEQATALQNLKQRAADLEQQNTELKHDNVELRRDLAAQTSMLTSRNRERERLQQMIEDLKLEQTNGARSVAGESIFERSISRAHQRSQSRVSDHTAITDAERDTWHKKEGELRDVHAELRLKYQELDRQHKTYLHYVSVLEGDFKEMEDELSDCHQEIQTLQKERDD